MEIPSWLESLLPTRGLKIIALILTPLLPWSGWAVEQISDLLQWTPSEGLTIWKWLLALVILITGLALALINTISEINKKNAQPLMKYYGNDDSAKIPPGVLVPIQIFDNGEYSFPGDILCATHSTPLTHELDKHFCTIPNCAVTIDMRQREDALTAADKLANRDIYVTQKKIPVEVDTYSSPMHGPYGHELRKNKP